jgi:hypothetical protein
MLPMQGQPEAGRPPNEEFRDIVTELYGDSPSDIEADEMATRLLAIYRGLSEPQDGIGLPEKRAD